jgi:hypothetical protein
MNELVAVLCVAFFFAGSILMIVRKKRQNKKTH